LRHDEITPHLYALPALAAKPWLEKKPPNARTYPVNVMLAREVAAINIPQRTEVAGAPDALMNWA
jgi:hypothetical protein